MILFSLVLKPSNSISLTLSLSIKTTTKTKEKTELLTSHIILSHKYTKKPELFTFFNALFCYFLYYIVEIYIKHI